MSGESKPKPLDAGTRFAERRAYPRWPLIAVAEIYEPIGRIRLEGRTSEISMGGCYVDVLNPLPEKTVIQLRIARDEGSFETWARVVYSQAGLGMGIAFFQAAPEQFKRLGEWIAALSA